MTLRVSGRIRGLFRDQARGIVLADIDRIWQAEGFAPRVTTSVLSSQRMSRWSEYEAAVDWLDDSHTRRVLRVYESVLLEFAAEEGLERFERALGLDGFTIDGNRRIAPAKLDLAGLSGLSALRDADGIREAFRRIELLMDEDPAGVVGASKELIEATAKSIVAAFEEPLMGNEKTPALVARAQALLGLGAGDVTNSIDSAPAVRRVLGGLASIAQGVAELRNAEGGGHGRSARSRLTARHARLAFNSARAWCEIVIDTHADPEAPFRATRTPASGS